MTPTLSFLARSRSAVTLAGNGKEQGEHGGHGTAWGRGLGALHGGSPQPPAPSPQCPCAPARPLPAPSAPATTTACRTAAGSGGGALLAAPM